MIMIFSLRSFNTQTSTNHHNKEENSQILPGGDTHTIYNIVGGVCYKYRWGDYYVGSSNVFFGGHIKSYNAGTCSNKDYVIASSTPCCFVCSFNETGNNNPTTLTEIERARNYPYSEVYIVSGSVTLTTSIIFPIQTSHVTVLANVLADPHYTCCGEIGIKGNIDYSGMIGGYGNLILTFIGFL